MVCKYYIKYVKILYCRRGVAVAHLGGPLYAVGGLDDTMCFNDVERYDPVSNSWSPAASLNSPRGGVAVACLDGYIYAGKLIGFV